MYADLLGYEPEKMETPMIWEGEAGGAAQPLEEYTQTNRATIDAEITQRTVDYIHARAADDDPFFCYVPFTLVHHPCLPHPDFEGRSGNGAFADAMMEVDFRAGQIVDALDNAGIADDTIVVWASDKLHFKEYGTDPGHRYKVDLEVPQLFNVAQDPKELWDIMEPNTWIGQAAVRHIGAYRLSLLEHPNVPVGGDGPTESAGTGPLTPRG